MTSKDNGSNDSNGNWSNSFRNVCALSLLGSSYVLYKTLNCVNSEARTDASPTTIYSLDEVAQHVTKEKVGIVNKNIPTL